MLEKYLKYILSIPYATSDNIPKTIPLEIKAFKVSSTSGKTEASFLKIRVKGHFILAELMFRLLYFIEKYNIQNVIYRAQ